ncbi:uncharacterized protein [Nicotiana sylvestris]|uniref:uncharacterized protein n=1 Tax=Nicotiana sylvestris TaxID=4096 RepID=UPI00388C6718
MTAFTTPWGTYCYRVMLFGLKSAGAIYMRALTAIFHDMMHQEIEVYVDDVIIKSRTQDDHVRDLRKFFERLRKYDLKLNPAKCAFRVPSGKLLSVGPTEPRKPLFLYLSVLENSFGCVLGQHDVTGKKEQSIYYLSKKFTSYEAKYTLLERTCCTLTWVTQKLRHYLLSYTIYLITRLDPLKYIFQKPMPTGRLAKWQILLTEFDIVYVTCTVMKPQALANHLAQNPIDDEYQPLSTYFPDEEVNSVEVILEDTNAWQMFFDGAVNAKGVEIGAILISPTSQHYPAPTRLRFFCRNNTAEYEAFIMGINMAVDQNVEDLLIMGDSNLITQQDQGEWETRDIKLIPYRQHVKDLSKQFKSIEFRCVDAQEDGKNMSEVHAGVHDDLIHALPLELHPMLASWSFIAWDMDVIGPIEPKASNEHIFILVAIEYFTRWVEAVILKAFTKKVVVDFVHSNIICHFGIPKTIITDNGANLNSHLIREENGLKLRFRFASHRVERVIKDEVQILYFENTLTVKLKNKLEAPEFIPSKPPCRTCIHHLDTPPNTVEDHIGTSKAGAIWMKIATRSDNEAIVRRPPMRAAKQKQAALTSSARSNRSKNRR